MMSRNALAIPPSHIFESDAHTVLHTLDEPAASNDTLDLRRARQHVESGHDQGSHGKVLVVEEAESATRNVLGNHVLCASSHIVGVTLLDGYRQVDGQGVPLTATLVACGFVLVRAEEEPIDHVRGRFVRGIGRANVDSLRKHREGKFVQDRASLDYDATLIIEKVDFHRFIDYQVLARKRPQSLHDQGPPTIKPDPTPPVPDDAMDNESAATLTSVLPLGWQAALQDL